MHRSFIEEHTRDALDPLESLLEIIKSGRSGRISATVWIELKPLKKKKLDRAKRNAAWLNSKFPLRTIENSFERGFSDSRWKSRSKLWLTRRIVRQAKGVPDSVKAKLAERLFLTSISVEVTSDTPNDVLHRRKLTDIQSAFSLLTDFSAVFIAERHSKSSFLLSTAEIATLWHPPTIENKVSRLDRSAFKELEPPPNLKRSNSQQIVTLGRVCFRNERFKFGMDLEARRRHLWILGKTGMGKSTLLKNIMRQDMERGRSFALIEPHGDLAENVLACVPKRRKNDIIYFDPADDSNRVMFNPLMVSDGSDKTLVADGVLSAFQKVFGMDESQAPRLLHIFRNSLLSLVEMPNATLLDAGRILIDTPYRKSVVARVSNPAVRSFWLDEFGKWKTHDRTAFIASLQNKLGAFLTNPKLQRVLSDPKAKLDMRKAMDDGRILIVNLSKGRLGENASNLLGTLLVTSLQLAAMSRSNIPEDDRRDFSIIMDEFQNVATPSISTFLSEARKYRTHLIVANQYTQQIPEQILAAILGNIGSQIAFQLGTTDAQLFETQFANTATATNLMSIPKYHAYGRILVAGMPSSTFSFSTTTAGQLK